MFIFHISAHVQKPSNAMYAVVLFNFKKRQKVKTKYLVPIGGAVPRPELAVSMSVGQNHANGSNIHVEMKISEKC